MAESDYPGIDTGLKFTKTGENERECPDCGNLCRENERWLKKRSEKLAFSLLFLEKRLIDGGT